MHPARSLKNRQHGLSMIGFLFVAFVLIMVAMLTMKLVPAYIEFFSVKKILAAMGQESDLKSKSNSEIRADFSKRATTSYVTEIKPEDLSVARPGGIPVISVDYEFRTPLVANVSLVVDFSASSDPNAVSAQIE